jgi:hypothetical protein
MLTDRTRMEKLARYERVVNNVALLKGIAATTKEQKSLKAAEKAALKANEIAKGAPLRERLLACGIPIGKTARITKKVLLLLAAKCDDFTSAFDDWGSSSRLKSTKAPALVGFAVAWASGSTLPDPPGQHYYSMYC